MRPLRSASSMLSLIVANLWNWRSNLNSAGRGLGKDNHNYLLFLQKNQVQKRRGMQVPRYLGQRRSHYCGYKDPWSLRGAREGKHDQAPPSVGRREVTVTSRRKRGPLTRQTHHRTALIILMLLSIVMVVLRPVNARLLRYLHTEHSLKQ
jgi:hypothetical protein